MKKALILASILALSGCRTLDPAAINVTVLDRPPTNCKQLGTVNIDWSWWGLSTESLNTLRNQTAELGGNAVLLQSDDVGTAYKCPDQRAQM